MFRAIRFIVVFNHRAKKIQNSALHIYKYLSFSLAVFLSILNYCFHGCLFFLLGGGDVTDSGNALNVALIQENRID